MRTIILVLALAAATATPASAAWTAKQLACIRSVGYTPEDWNAYRLPAGPAAAYRACRDKNKK